MGILKIILITGLTMLISATGIYNYMPLKWLDISSSKPLVIGGLTTLNSTDNLSDFPTTYNANLNQLMEKATTTLYELTTANSITSATGLTAIGTITTGTWTADPIGVGYGGTGTTSPTLYQVLLGAGANGLGVVSGFGTAGDSLVSNGAGAAPTWQAVGVNQNDNYAWTGIHTFANSTVSVMGALYLGNGTATTTFNLNPAGATASSTAFVGDGAGNYYNTPMSYLAMASTTDSVANSVSATNTLIAYTVPANTLRGGGVIKGTAAFELTTGVLNAGNDSMEITLNFGGILVATSSPNWGVGAGEEGTHSGELSFTLIESGTNSQEGSFSFNGIESYQLPSQGLNIGSLLYQTTAINTASDQTLTLEAKMGDSDMNITIRNVYIEIIR